MSAPTIDTCPGVTPVVELGVGATYDDASTAQWDVDHWDDEESSHWVGDKPFWYDITCHVLDITTFAGRERAIDQWEVGTATVVCENSDGWADYPRDLGSPTLLSIRPGRSIRIGVKIDKDPVLHLLWAGYLDAANPSYDADAGSTMTFECIDAKGDAGRAEVAKLATAVGASETVTARIGRILNASGYPSYRRSIDSSGVTLIADTLGAKAVDLLDQAADSAGGSVFGDLGFDDGDPRVAFRGRDWPNYDKNDPIQGTIGDYGFGGIPEHYQYEIELVDDGDGLYDPTGVVTIEESPPGSGMVIITAPVDLVWIETSPGLVKLVGGDLIPAVPADTCPSSWELSFARADITTQALLGRPDEVEFTYPTPAMLAITANGFQAGLSMFGVEPYKRNDILTSLTGEIDWLGNRILTTRSWRFMPRVAAVTITGSADHPETIGTLVQASPFVPARFNCQHRIDGRDVFNRNLMVTGIAHTINPQGWSARISLDDAEPFLVGGTQPAHWDETGVAEWSDDTHHLATWADPV